MNIIGINNTSSDIEIPDLHKFMITVSGSENLADYFSLSELASSDNLIEKISDEDIFISNGEEILSKSDAIKFVTLHNIPYGPRDRSGKMRVHQTSRKLGLRIMWTGVGDDSTDPSSIGGGERFTFQYNAGDADPMVKYIDFNVVENETWLHEGYITWKGGVADYLSLQLVTRPTDVVSSETGDYDLYGGYLIVPAVPGTGSIDIISDITTHSGGIVYIPDNDLGESPTAFWDAEWNSSTQKYENIIPDPTGNGRYNMFATEIVLAEFVRELPLLGDGFIALNSSDTDQIGHGMRLKMLADTNNDVPDHDWFVACIMCLHRNKSV